MKSGYRLVLDSWDDTGLSGKHAHVYDFFEVKSVNVTGFTSTLGYIYNLSIAHILYEFYKEDGTVVFIEQNNTKYMEDNMMIPWLTLFNVNILM